MNDDRFKNLFELTDYLKNTERTQSLFQIIFNNEFEVYKERKDFPTCIENSNIEVPPFIAVIFDDKTKQEYLITDIHVSMGTVNDIQLMWLYNTKNGEWFYIDHPVYKNVE